MPGADVYIAPARSSASLIIGLDETVMKNEWTNALGTTTANSLSIRLATGRFRETYSSKDTKGKPSFFEKTGFCLRYEKGISE